MTSRRKFSTLTQRLALSRSKGICECHRVPQLPTFKVGCGRPLGGGNTFFEHITPDAIGGSNDIDNCAALTKTCWGAKTATYDLPVIAKAKRTFDKHFGIRNPHRQRIPGGKHDALKRKLSGEVVRR